MASYKRISNDYTRYLKTTKWRLKMRECFITAGRRCEVCFDKTGIQAHHYNYKRLFEETQNDLFCLCKTCHEKYHKMVPGTKLPQDTDLSRKDRFKHIKEMIKLSDKKP